MAKTVRLQKYLSEAGVCSRRKAEKLILEGAVRVNGMVVKELGVSIAPGKDNIQVGNKVIRPAEKGVILLNKPRGVVCTVSDPEGRKTVMDYLTKPYRSYFPVGRLDYDSSGLLILTNDGDLANRLMHPRYEFNRTYEVRVRGYVTPKAVERLLKGVRLEDGPAKAVSLRLFEAESESSLLEIVVSEGRNRLVRRMFDALGHPVMKLKRTRHGPVALGKLKGGEIRKLTNKEYQKLVELVFSPC